MKRWVGCLVVMGCTLPEPRWIGEHVQLAADQGLEPCGDVVGHMDAYIKKIAAELNVPAPVGDDRIIYYWLHETDFAQRTICINEDACSLRGDVYAVALPLDHELVHALVRGHGTPPPFFLEGLAVAYEVALPADPRETYPIDALLAGTSVIEAIEARESGWLPPSRYPLAGAFMAFLIKRHGVPAVMRLYDRLRLLDGLGRISRVFEAEFGETLVAASGVFEEEVAGCTLRGARLKTFECAAPEIGWDQRSLAMWQAIGCEEDGAIGPFAGEDVLVLRTLEVEKDGVFEVSLVGDSVDGSEGRWNRAILARCGGCEGYVELTISEADGVVRAALKAGTYAVQLLGPARVTTGMGLRVERVADKFP